MGYHFQDLISRTNDSIPLSNIVSSYYGTSGRTLYRLSKFTRFARIVGLGELTNNVFTGGIHQFNKGDWFKGKNKFSSEDEWVDYYADQVTKSATQFILGVDKNIPNAWLASNQKTSAKVLLRLFLNALKNEINNERI
jgi:hypothetical protein